jgi:hypothetical protein
MDFNYFLLLAETSLPELKQELVDHTIRTILKLDSGVEFEVTIWQEFNDDSQQASIQFYQIKNGDIVTRRDEDQKGLDPKEFVQLFLGIEQIIIGYFDKFKDIKVIKIHPEAIGKRSGLMDKRNRKDTGRESQYDPNKANAYMQLFNYSKLKQMGYKISKNAEYIFIEKT